MDFLWMLSDLRNPYLDTLFQWITCLGQETLVIAFICTLYWCVNKRLAYQIGFAYYTAGLLIQSLKITFRVPRPWNLDPNFAAVEGAIPAATGYSFPSGHTQAATALYGSWAAVSRKLWQKVLLICTFWLVAFSRMYLGVHTPKDVLISMGITLFFTWLAWRLRLVLLDDPKYTKVITVILILISITVSIYALTLLRLGTIEIKYASDCCKAAGAGLGFAVGFFIERTYLDFDTKTKTKLAQLVKLGAGLALTLLLKTHLPVFIGKSIGAKICEYFILTLWILVIYPYVFSRFSLRRDR